MSQSFDKKVGSRLQHYEPSPPAHLKSKVFKVVSPQKGLNGWQVTWMVFFAISLLFWSQGALSGSEQVAVRASVAGARVETKVPDESSQNIDQAVDRPIEQVKGEENLATQTVDEQSIERTEVKNEDAPAPSDRVFAIADETSTVREKSTVIESLESTSEEKQNTLSYQGDTYSWCEKEDQEVWQLNPRFLGIDRPAVGMLNWQPQQRKAMVLSKELKPSKRSVQVPIYVESGLFFLYQQAFPNMSDELVITEFEGAAGLSSKRLGAFVEAGTYFFPWRKMRVQIGAKVNTYQQSYRFGIRGFAADEVQVTQMGDEIVFNPIFEEEKITIDHRLYSAGLKAAANWNIFPSYTTELTTAVEYLAVLNKQQQFEYDGRNYEIGYADHLLLSLGVRKVLLENEKGMLQLHPSIRYSLNQVTPEQRQVLSMKPYSVGISVSYLFGNFRERYKDF